MKTVVAICDSLEGDKLIAFSEAGDKIIAELITPAGLRLSPVKGDRGLFVVHRNKWHIKAILSDFSGLRMGERELKGAFGQSIFYNEVGEVVINDGTDYAVKYEKLKKEFDDLVDFVNALKTRLETATYINSTNSPTLLALTLQEPCTADISDAKVEKIRI
jgi:hypothetical protein